MSFDDVALVLGPVAFAGFEVPERIGFGGAQRLAVHDLPGGQRVIDALGPMPADIAWNGIFSGPDATLRARMLETLCAQGAVLPLSWDVFFYNVVIAGFEASYRNGAWVPYRLRVSVLGDPASAALDALADLVADATGDAASAGGFASLAGIDLSTLQTSIAAPQATVLRTAGYFAATTALSAAQAGVQTGLAAANASLGSYAQRLAGAAAVTGMIGAAGNAAALSATNAYLQRLSINMENASS